MMSGCTCVLVLDVCNIVALFYVLIFHVLYMHVMYIFMRKICDYVVIF